VLDAGLAHAQLELRPHAGRWLDVDVLAAMQGNRQIPTGSAAHVEDGIRGLDIRQECLQGVVLTEGVLAIPRRARLPAVRRLLPTWRPAFDSAEIALGRLHHCFLHVCRRLVRAAAPCMFYRRLENVMTS